MKGALMQVKENEARIAVLEARFASLGEQDLLEKEAIEKEIAMIEEQAYSTLNAWDIVYLSRHPKRPKASDYVQALFDDFIEFHGDRCFGDDGACVGGIASFHGIPVTLITQSKGKTLEENMKKNFGMLHPEGYRKALRLAHQAEKFHRPIITMVDTSGAYPGKGAEERGQAQAIAECLEVFSGLKTPVVAIVLSEGGSGGALAFSVADKILMLENAIYSVLSPEGFASILWKDEKRAEEAAEVMELTAADLKRKGIIDTIIKEPRGGAHKDFHAVCEQLDKELYLEILQLCTMNYDVMLEKRYEKFRKMGLAYEIV